MRSLLLVPYERRPWMQCEVLALQSDVVSHSYWHGHGVRKLGATMVLNSSASIKYASNLRRNKDWLTFIVCLPIPAENSAQNDDARASQDDKPDFIIGVLTSSSASKSSAG